MNVKGMVTSLPECNKKELGLVLSICRRNAPNKYAAKRDMSYARDMYLKLFYSGKMI